MDVRELALRTVEAMQVYGLAPHTAWEEHSRTHNQIIKLHEAKGQTEFNREIVTEYVQQVERRFERGEFGISHYRNLIRASQRLTEMHDTGRLDWSAPKKKSGFRLNEYYENIRSSYISAGGFSPKGTSDATWVCRKYFAWLILEGHAELSGVGVSEIQRFIIHCSHHMKGTGLHNVKLYMKKLYAYLAGNGYAADDYSGLFAFPVSRVSRLFPALPPSEIAAMLELINKRTPKGKRDYAIVLLGVVMGLRAIDIARLRLTDIDWRMGEIKIVQAKTGKSLALPLTKDVGEAIRDYILHGRPETTTDTLFLSCHAPFRGFSNGVAIGDMYDYYRLRAGLPRDAYDGKGFHALRRTLGKNLITSGISVNMVAQVFGGEDIDATEKYIALDSEHLKECALGFAGIAPKGGVYCE